MGGGGFALTFLKPSSVYLNITNKNRLKFSYLVYFAQTAMFANKIILLRKQKLNEEKPESQQDKVEFCTKKILFHN